VACEVTVLATAIVAGGSTRSELGGQAKVLRPRVVKRLGARAPGRDIVRWGVVVGHGVRRPTVAELRRYVGVLDRMVHPVAVVRAAYTRVVSTNTSANTSTGQGEGVRRIDSGAATSGGGAAGLPACASESGSNYSTGPGNTNPSTGATGRYQEMPMHRQPGGLCYGMDLSPRGQDRCASRIYAAQGSGAWVGCGG
jgi:hypothetical protein